MDKLRSANDSRMLQSVIICPYCHGILPRIENREDFVDSTVVDDCDACGKRFFLVLQWNGYTVEDMRDNYDKVYRKGSK
jgi:hypothetical protein